MSHDLTLLILPTKNEHVTIHTVMEEVTALGLDHLHVLVVDDDSIDGTWRTYGTRWAADSERNHLLRRCGPEKGRGYAMREAYEWVVNNERDYTYVIEMAANGSDDPAHIPAIIEALSGGADVVVGERPADEKAAAGPRRVQGMARWATGASVGDVESGYRGFRKPVLAAVSPKLKATSHEIKTEVVAAAAKRGFKFASVPVTSRALPEAAYAQGGQAGAGKLIGLWMRRMIGGV